MAEINPAFINHLNRIAATSSATTTSPNAETGGNSSGKFWGEDGFSFGDILDFLNPLQNLPVVGSLYRAVTGDEISTWTTMADGKGMRTLTSVSISGYKIAHLPELVKPFEMKAWDAAMRELGSRLGASVPAQ